MNRITLTDRDGRPVIVRADRIEFTTVFIPNSSMELFTNVWTFGGGRIQVLESQERVWQLVDEGEDAPV